MPEKLKNVSTEYQIRLELLADLLVTSRRFGGVALRDTIEVGDNESQLLLFDNERNESQLPLFDS